MDASSKIQRSIHDVRLTYKYVSRILGTYHSRAAIILATAMTLRAFSGNSHFTLRAIYPLSHSTL